MELRLVNYSKKNEIIRNQPDCSMGTTRNNSHLLSKVVNLRLSVCSIGGGWVKNSARPSAVSFLHELRFRSVNDEHPSILGKPERMTLDCSMGATQSGFLLTCQALAGTRIQ